MKSIAERINEKFRTPYKAVAKEFGTDEMYVRQIAGGFRNPKRGKGLLIKKKLEEILKQNK